MYMTLNESYQNYKNNKISLEELKSITLESVFREKYYFKLYQYSEDELNDFILIFNRYLTRIIKKYDESKGYYQVYIHFTVDTIKRAKYFKSIKKESKETVLLNYAIEEAALTICDEEPKYYSSKSPKLDIDFKKIIKTNNQKKLSTQQRMKIIILKSCYYLSDDHLNSICEEFDISFDEMKKDIDKIKKTLKNKCLLKNRKNQNKNYIFHMEYIFLLSHQKCQRCRTYSKHHFCMFLTYEALTIRHR